MSDGENPVIDELMDGADLMFARAVADRAFGAELLVAAFSFLGYQTAHVGIPLDEGIDGFRELAEQVRDAMTAEITAEALN